MLSAALFDLDGVIVSTSVNHYLAWKKLADMEGIPFDEVVNERLNGVARVRCLEIILEKSKRMYSPEEKYGKCEAKNASERLINVEFRTKRNH